MRPKFGYLLRLGRLHECAVSVANNQKRQSQCCSREYNASCRTSGVCIAETVSCHYFLNYDNNNTHRNQKQTYKLRPVLYLATCGCLRRLRQTTCLHPHCQHQQTDPHLLLSETRKYEEHMAPGFPWVPNSGDSSKTDAERSCQSTHHPKLRDKRVRGVNAGGAPTTTTYRLQCDSEGGKCLCRMGKTRRWCCGMPDPRCPSATPDGCHTRISDTCRNLQY